MEKSLSYTVGEFIFPGVNGEEGRLGFILLNFIFSQFHSKCPKTFGIDAYKLKLIELVLFFLPQANKLSIRDHIRLWNYLLTFRDFSLSAWMYFQLGLFCTRL